MYSTLAMDSLPACSMCFQWHFFYLFLFWTFFQDLETLTPLSKHHHPPPNKKTQHPPQPNQSKNLCICSLLFVPGSFSRALSPAVLWVLQNTLSTPYFCLLTLSCSLQTASSPQPPYPFPVHLYKLMLPGSPPNSSLT